jgi:hypothetical protein
MDLTVAGIFLVRFRIFTAASMNMAAFWVVARCYMVVHS